MAPASPKPLPRVRVVLTRKAAFGDTPVEHAVDWPANWRLPTAGESVFVSPEIGGQVRYLEFDVAAHVVRLVLG